MNRYKNPSPTISFVMLVTTRKIFTLVVTSLDIQITRMVITKCNLMLDKSEQLNKVVKLVYLTILRSCLAIRQ